MNIIYAQITEVAYLTLWRQFQMVERMRTP